MPRDEATGAGTWEAPVVLACPDHQQSYTAQRLAPHLDPAAFFGCYHRDHGTVPFRWATCNRGWDGFDRSLANDHHDWADA